METLKSEMYMTLAVYILVNVTVIINTSMYFFSICLVDYAKVFRSYNLYSVYIRK